jgi:hypothetical protein
MISVTIQPLTLNRLNKKIIYLAAWVSFGGLGSCGKWAKPQPPPVAETQQPTSAIVAPAVGSKAQIQLMIFQLIADSTAAAGERCALISTQRFEGRLKKSLKPPDFIQPGDLICTFLDANGAVLSTHVEEDPLTASVEAAEEDGTLKRHLIQRTSAELVLRVQHTPDLRQLVVGKVMNNQSITIIATFAL